MQGDSTSIVQPISELASIAARIDGQLTDVKEQRSALTQIRRRPEVLSGATLNRCIELYSRQRDCLVGYKNQLAHWQKLPLTLEQQLEVNRLDAELRQLYIELTDILALMQELKQGRIEKRRANGDIELDVAATRSTFKSSPLR